MLFYVADACNVIFVCDVTTGLGPKQFFFIYPAHLLFILLFRNKSLRVLAFIPVKS